jgi:Kef-type K+ transport system membrane component KefB/mannitol/fructose-specific phosphotransferase system IIA component
MDRLSPSDIAAMFAALGLMLAAARILAELAQRAGQPAVIGEILAGVLLGPTVLGRLAPGVCATLFPAHGPLAIALDGLTTLAIALYLIVAGMEVNLSSIARQGRVAAVVSAAGMVVPFALGFGVALGLPGLLGREVGQDAMLFALFFATVMSISALPVIARTLIDLGLYRSDLGMIVIAAAVVNDLAGWGVFAAILGMMGHGGETHGVGRSLWLLAGFVAFVLLALRPFVHRALPWLQAHASWPGGVLSFALCLSLLGAAFTEWIGVHAIIGAFFVGVALGDSAHLRRHTRAVIDQFVSFIFAPLFFASIGLRVDFAAHFDALLVVTVLVIACVGKVVGCGLGARLAGMAPREAWAVGFGLNARGAMEIILGLLALQYGLIRSRMFVALVVMALVTSVMSGPIMQRLVRRRRPRRFTDFMSARAFVDELDAVDAAGAIGELAEAAAAATRDLDAPAAAAAVLAREQLQPTGLQHGVAVPHARLTALAAPVVAIGLSQRGIDFDAPDGAPARIVVLILTPTHDDGAQLEILADIARRFQDAELRDQIVHVRNFRELIALLKTRHDGPEEH